MGAVGLVPWLGRALHGLRPRMLPSIVIVGAQKAGTSALFSILSAHPRIIPPAEKELDFFNVDERYAQGMALYRTQLPVRPWRGTGWITLDATPGYLQHPQAAARINEHLPDALIVVVLRDPVARAYSDWNMFHQFKDHRKYAALYDDRNFEQAVDDELAGRNVNKAHRYLWRGHYAPQLRPYLEQFGKDRVMVFAYPELRDTPQAVADAIALKAGLPRHVFSDGILGARQNTRPYAGGMSEELSQRLSAHFEPLNRELTELLGAQPDLRESASS